MDTRDANILVVDDNEDILLAAQLLLENQVGTITTLSNPFQIDQAMAERTYDVILLDMNFSRNSSQGEEGIYWLRHILTKDPLAVVILITAYGDIDLAVKAIKQGATDFVLKPWQNEKLWATINSAIKYRQNKTKLERLRQTQSQLSSDLDTPFSDFIGVCPAMKSIFRTIEKVAGTDASVLILGENGTGKEVVARALHRNSNRSDRSFIGVDVGAVSSSLFESELFGHVKGSFTSAVENRIGRIETANGGTLFLDEIGNLSESQQSKLLTVLEKREVTQIGSNQSKPIDIRLISATNLPVYQSVAEGKFRQDLLYRINTVEIYLPPLKDRKEDLPFLAELFLSKALKKYNKEITGFDREVIELFASYHWPGNVREMQHAIERAVIMSSSDSLLPSDFSIFNTSTSNGGYRDNRHDYCDQNLNHLERKTILSVIAQNNGNISHSAKELGLTRASLYRRLKKYDL